MNNTTILVFGITTILVFYGGANYYIAQRMYQWLNLIFPHMNAALFMAGYILIAFSLVLCFLPLRFGFKHIINVIGAYWMGIFIYLLIFLLMADLGLLLGGAVRIIPSPIPPNVHFYAGLIAVLLTIGFVSYGIYNANQIKHVSYDIQTGKNSWSGDVKIVLVSDLHLGAVGSERKLASIVREINDLEPDIVCIAGDLFDNNFLALKNPSAAADLLKNIAAKYGVYACLGNHDGGSTFGEMVGFMEQNNITLLNDDYVIIDEQIILFGRVDSAPIGGFGELRRRDIADTLTALKDINLPVVVMDHNPVSIEQYGEEVDLVLFGHTHQGQIFPGKLITNRLFVTDHGYYQKDNNSPHVVVTSGVGTWGMPMRVGSSCEIVSVKLH